MHYDYTWVTSHRHWQCMNFDDCCTFNVQLCWFFTTRWLELWAWPKILVPAGIVTIPPVTVTGRKSVTGTSLYVIDLFCARFCLVFAGSTPSPTGHYSKSFKLELKRFKF